MASPRDRMTIALAVCAIVVARSAAAIVLPVYDDAFISFRYADNLMRGVGFVYNPGEWVLGVTAPLWGILLAVLSALHLPLPPAVVVLNILLDVGSYLLIVWMIADAGDTGVAEIVAFLFGISPIAARICVGGMEMSLFLFLSLGTIGLYLHNWRQLSLLSAALLVFVRPEGVLLAAILVAIECRESGVRRVAVLSVLPALVLAIAGGVLYAVYGSVIPHSVQAKANSMFCAASVVVKELVFTDYLCIVLTPFAFVGAWKRFRAHKVYGILMLWLSLYVSAYLIARPWTWSWYGEPVHFVEFLLAAAGIWELAQNVRAYRTWSVSIHRVAYLLAALFWVAVLVWGGSSAVTTRLYRRIEVWAKSSVRPGLTLYASDIGAIGYYSSLYVFDGAGLISPGRVVPTAGREMILLNHPDFLFLNSTKSSVEMMNRPPFDSLYRLSGRFSTDEHPPVSMDPERYEDVWKQDYLLFTRNSLVRF